MNLLETIDHGEWEELQRMYLMESRKVRSNNINNHSQMDICWSASLIPVLSFYIRLP